MPSEKASSRRRPKSKPSPEALPAPPALQDALEESNARYADIYQHSPVGHVVYGRRGKLQAVNFAVSALLGRTRDAMLDLPFSVFVAPQDLQKYLTHVNKCRDSGQTERVVLLLLRSSGETVPVELYTLALPDPRDRKSLQYQTIMIDLSGQRRAEVALRESEQRYYALADALPQFIVVATPEGHVDYCNNHALNFTGLELDAFTSKWLQFLYPGDLKLADESWKQVVESGKRMEVELRFLRKKDGASVWHRCLFLPVRGVEGKVAWILAVAVDIQRAKSSEAEAGELLSQLGQHNEQLEGVARKRTAKLKKTSRELQAETGERLRLEREVLEITEHERRKFGQELHDGLCQKMFGVALYSKALSRRLIEKNPTEAEAAARVATLLTASVNEARNLSHGLFPPAFDTEGLISSLRELAASFGKNPRCTFQCDRKLQIADDTVALNLYRITQEAMNNVVKHSQAKNATIKLVAQDKKLLLEISDDGVGMPKNDKKTKGVGIHTMGYRSRIIGGSLLVNSMPGKGTTILCSVPIQERKESKHEGRGGKKSDDRG